jgi:hypothetical protein
MKPAGFAQYQIVAVFAECRFVAVFAEFLVVLPPLQWMKLNLTMLRKFLVLKQPLT